MNANLVRHHPRCARWTGWVCIFLIVTAAIVVCIG